MERTPNAIFDLLDGAPDDYDHLFDFFDAGAIDDETIREAQRLRHELLAGLAANRWPEAEVSRALQAVESVLITVHGTYASLGACQGNRDAWQRLLAHAALSDQ